MLTHTLGFPRIGEKRELKKALEGFWKGQKTEEELLATASQLRLRHWRMQQEQGIDLLPCGDFSLYDHVLDTLAMVGAVPGRFQWNYNKVNLQTYFAMARGSQGQNACPAMEMSKWFDTNYHYIVPELEPDQSFQLASFHLFDQVLEAKRAGFRVKPVVLGPLTLLRLGKCSNRNFSLLTHIDVLLPIYENIIQELAIHAEWIQIDEPILVLDMTEEEKIVFLLVYDRLTKAAVPAKILMASYFGSLDNNTKLACSPRLGALHIDLVRAPKQIDIVLDHLPDDVSLSLGIVNGRNIWKIDMNSALRTIDHIMDKIGEDRVLLGTSCSLLHTPIDLDEETGFDPEIHSWLSFAKQKCGELRTLADYCMGRDVHLAINENQNAIQTRRASSRVYKESVWKRFWQFEEDIKPRKTPFSERLIKQQAHLKLPLFPTTTIGSFPQTQEIRNIRRSFKQGILSANEYTNLIDKEIRTAITFQEEIGLDVLVHGEAERNDMVEFFGAQLSGFCFTQNGWVQSYGSRCVKPPIIYGDIARPKSMTCQHIKHRFPQGV